MEKPIQAPVAEIQATEKQQADAIQATSAKVTGTIHKFADEAKAAGTRQVDVINGSSAKVLNVYHDICASWLAHRNEDMRIGMEAVNRLSECRDIGKAAEIYSGWVTDSVRRLQAELSSAPTEITKLGNQYLKTAKGLATATHGWA